MDPVHRALLRAHTLDLSGKLLVGESIVPFLYQEEVLTGSQVEDILSRSTEDQKTRRLLELLPNRGPRAFTCFIRSLDDFSWVRDQLLLELNTRSGPGPEPEPAPGPEPATGPEPAPGPGSTVPESVLQKVPSDRDLSRLASRLGSEWEVVLMDLGLSSVELFRCRSDHRLSTHGAVLAGLVQWRRSEGKKATVHRLLQSLTAAGVHLSVLEDAMM